jgi:hypothetical protein
MLAYRMGGQFEIQSAVDHWHIMIRILKRIGVRAIRKYMFKGRIIWPGSLFIDPKVIQHRRIEYPTSVAAYLPSPYTIPAYVEMDHGLTLRLQALARLSDDVSITPDAGMIANEIRERLDTQARDSRRRYGPRATPARGYISGLERLESLPVGREHRPRE